jgi:hypothetical protein
MQLVRTLVLLLLLPLAAFGQAQSTLLEDDFNTDGRDAAKWNLAQPISGANSGSVTITEADSAWADRLSIVGPSATGGTNVGGYESFSSFNCSTAGCVMVVEVVESERGRGHTAGIGEHATVGVTLGTEWNNGITMQFYENQKWELMVNQAGSRLIPAGTYLEGDSVDIKWFRFRLTSANAWIDTSPDGVEWTQRGTAAHSMTITAFRAYLWGGTFGSQTTASDRAVRKAVFDNFSLKTMPYQAVIGSWETAAAGATVSLSGASSVANGATVTARSWTCELGTGLTCPSITNSTSESASLVAPTPSGDNGSMRIRYTVTASTTSYIAEKYIYVVKTDADGLITVADSSILAVLGSLTPRGSGSPNRVSPLERQYEERAQLHGDYAADIGAAQIRGVITITNGSTNVTGVGTKFTEDIAPTGANCGGLYAPRLLGAGCGIVRFDGGGNPDASWLVSQVISDTQLTLTANAGASVTLNDATTVFTNGTISSTGNVYSNLFPEAINYYDAVWVHYQNYYRSGNPKFLTIAEKWGHAWATGLWRGGVNMTHQPRRWGARGLMIWALRNPSDVAEAKLWDQLQDRASSEFDQYLDMSPSIVNLIDLRETAYINLHGALLSRVLPNSYEDRPSGTVSNGSTLRSDWVTKINAAYPGWWEPQMIRGGYWEMNGASGGQASPAGFWQNYTQPFMVGFFAEAAMVAWPVIDATAKASVQRMITRVADENWGYNRKGASYMRTQELMNSPGRYLRGTHYAVYGRNSSSAELVSEAWATPTKWNKFEYMGFGWSHEDALKWQWLNSTLGDGLYASNRANAFMAPQIMGAAYYMTGNTHFRDALDDTLDAHAGTSLITYGVSDPSAGSWINVDLTGQLSNVKPWIEGYRTSMQAYALRSKTPGATVTLPGAPSISVSSTGTDQITISITHGTNGDATTLRRSESPDGPFIEVRGCQYVTGSSCLDGDPTAVVAGTVGLSGASEGRYGPRNGRSYYYKAYSYNEGGAGVDSTKLGPVSLTATGGVPNSPTGLSCDDATGTTNYFTCTWTAPAGGATDYRIEYSYESQGAVGGLTALPRWMPYAATATPDITASTTFTFTPGNLLTTGSSWNNDLTYCVRVYARNGSGESTLPSNEDCVRATSTGGGTTNGAIALPATPSATPTVSGTGTSRTITFPATPSGWNHWIVKRKSADSEPFTVLDFSETGSSYVDNTATNGATYWYAVSPADSSDRMGGQSLQVESSGGGSPSMLRVRRARVRGRARS